jgi:hypothetical protein
LQTETVRAMEMPMRQEVIKMYKADFRAIHNGSEGLILEKKNPKFVEILGKDWDDFWSTMKDKI